MANVGLPCALPPPNLTAHYGQIRRSGAWDWRCESTRNMLLILITDTSPLINAPMHPYCGLPEEFQDLIWIKEQVRSKCSDWMRSAGFRINRRARRNPRRSMARVRTLFISNAHRSCWRMTIIMVLVGESRGPEFCEGETHSCCRVRHTWISGHLV